MARKATSAVTAQYIRKLEATIEKLMERVAKIERNTVLGLDGILTVRRTGRCVDVVLAGANLNIVNGTGRTGRVNGCGNLVIGYNARRSGGSRRTGSHNLIVGDQHDYTAAAGVVFGFKNSSTGTYATVTGGWNNTASGYGSIVAAGVNNTASGRGASVCGGATNTAAGNWSSVTGGMENNATGDHAVVSGGFTNNASGWLSSISGGGGEANRGNRASGVRSSICGGEENRASGTATAILGGRAQTSATAHQTIPALP